VGLTFKKASDLKWKHFIFSSEVVVFAVRENLVLGLEQFLLHLLELVFGDGDFDGGEDGRLNKSQVSIVDHATEEPDEGLLELIIALGRDVIVLQVLLAMESDLLGFHFSVTHINFIAYKHNGDGFAHTGQILVPLGHVGVGDTGAHVEHDDTAVATDIVTIAESSEFLLTSGIPNVEYDVAVGGVEGHGVNLDTKSSDVALFEFSSQVTLDKGGLANATVSNENELELGRGLLLLLLNHFFCF
jgi:hypothetical protein